MGRLTNIWQFLEEEGDHGPSRLDRYEVKERIGEGGMAFVLHARDRNLDRPVAIKVLKERFQTSDIVRERFRREAETLAKIHHPNIVHVHDACLEGDHLFLVMEYVDGSPLIDVLSRGNHDRNALVRMLKDVARGVHVAHQQGIVHRDIKPENIILTKEGQPKLVDFGVAHLQGTAGGLTRTDAKIGTPLYMAPEQVSSDTAPISPRTDVYALGVILYEILAGKTPFEGDTPAELFRKILQEEPASPRAADEDVPRPLEIICRKAMEKKPSRRYPSAEALADDVDRFLRGETIEAEPPSAFDRLRRRIRRRMGLVAFSGAAMLLGVALIVTLTAETVRPNVPKEPAPRFEAHVESGRAILGNIADLLGSTQWRPEEVRSLAAKARAELEKALPRREAYLLIGRSYALENQPARALEFFGRAVEADGVYPSAHLERALTVLDLHRMTGAGSLEQAEADLKVVRDSSGERREVLLAEGMILRIRGRTREAVEKLAVYSVESVSDARAWFWTADAHYELGEFAHAVSACQRVLQYRPRTKYAATLLAQAYMSSDRPDRAVKVLDNSLKICGPAPDTYLFRAEARRRAGDRVGARADFDDAIRLKSDFVPAYNQRGLFRSELGNIRGALEDFDVVVRLQPDHAGGYLNRGRLLMDQGELDRALRDFDRAIELRPGYSKAHVNRGMIRDIRGDRKGALQDYSEAIRLEPNRASAYVNRGSIFTDMKDYDRALADFDKAIALDPGLVMAYSNRGNVHRVRGNLNQAVRDYERALAIDPKHGYANANLGLTLRMLGRLDDAIRHLELALRHGPRVWDLRPEIGKTLAEAKRARGR